MDLVKSLYTLWLALKLLLSFCLICKALHDCYDWATALHPYFAFAERRARGVAAGLRGYWCNRRVVSF